MEEFDESEVEAIINTALASHFDSDNGKPYLGLAETDLMQSLHQRLSKRFIESELNDVFQDVRKDFLSRKISTTIKDLHTVTKNCRRCSLDSSPELPMWNSNNPDIVVVVDSPSLTQEAISVMISAFKKADLSSDQLCLTYVNRCPVKRKHEPEEISNCVPYLHAEIQTLNPKLVLTMGSLPASVLFGTPMKIKDFRGQVTWLGYWPIIPTYSPFYALKSGDVAKESFENDIMNASMFINS